MEDRLITYRLPGNKKGSTMNRDAIRAIDKLAIRTKQYYNKELKSGNLLNAAMDSVKKFNGEVPTINWLLERAEKING